MSLDRGFGRFVMQPENKILLRGWIIRAANHIDGRVLDTGGLSGLLVGRSTQVELEG